LLLDTVADVVAATERELQCVPDDSTGYLCNRYGKRDTVTIVSERGYAMAEQTNRFAQQPPVCRRGQAGQATVEFVLSLGLVLLLLLSALDFGRAFFGYIALVNAAREGARAGVMSQNPAMISSAVSQELQGNSLINLSLLTTTYTWGGSGQPLVVNLSYRFDLIVTSFLPFSSLTLRTSATMAIP
jgi:hypothetical protein